MKAKKEAKRNKLAQNHQKATIVSMLIEVKKAESPVLAWRIVFDKKITCPIKIRFVRSNRNELECIVKGENHATFEQILSGEETLNIFLPESNTLFQTDVVNWKSGELILKIPKMVAIQERRRHFRLNIKESWKAETSFVKEYTPNGFSIKKHKMNKKCHDVSKGGLSFILTKQEARMFMIEEEIEKVQLEIDKRIFVIDMELVNLINVEPDANNKLLYSGLKACFKFNKISSEAEEYIDNFVIKNIDYDKVA
jgi:hypothetical protein